MNSTAYHEAGHALSAYYFGLSFPLVTIRQTADSYGRCPIQDGHLTDDFSAAIVMVAGQVAERMALGRERVYPNWLDPDDPDMDSARHFVQKSCEDELDGRQTVQLRARSLLRTKWNAVEAIARKLERETTLLGSDVADICKREGVKRHGTISKAEAMKKLSPKGRAAITGKRAPDGKRNIEYRSNPTQLAEVEQQIAEIQAQLMEPGDDPALWPLRKKLASLHHKRQELIAQ